MASDTIQSVTIERFRSIRAIKDLRLRPINLLIGANGSGKSNFLEAFRLLGQNNDGHLGPYVAYHGGANKILHFGSKITQTIHLALRSNSGFFSDAYYSIAANDELSGAVSTGGFIRNGPTFDLYQFKDTGNFSPFKYTNVIDDNRSLRANGSNLAAYLHLLSKRYSESYEMIRKTVRQAAPFFDDFQLLPLALNPGTIKLEWRHVGSDSYFDISSLSDGTLRFMALATLFLQPVELRPSVILVDEPELGLHPYAIGLLASLIKQASKDTQVIVATQSPLLLDYFEPEDILVANRVDGATTIGRLKPEPLAEWLTEYSLGQLWEKGELGGRPGKE
jgi:predicted ATPase